MTTGRHSLRLYLKETFPHFLLRVGHTLFPLTIQPTSKASPVGRQRRRNEDLLIAAFYRFSCELDSKTPTKIINISELIIPGFNKT